MTDRNQYRSDPIETVRLFRPVLRALKIRQKDGHLPVFLASFDQLAFLNFDECSIQFAAGKIEAASLFIAKYTSQGRLLRAYIIVNEKLFDSQNKGMKEMRKIAGVHEFIHFLALIFASTLSSREEMRSMLLGRLHNKVENLWAPNLLDLYYSLSGRPGYEHKEYTDSHFRSGYDGQTPDYEVLFLHFLFSRELFEEYFDREKQIQFRELYTSGQAENATRLLLDTLRTAADDKDVPYNTAKNQLFEWAQVYFRSN